MCLDTVTQTENLPKWGVGYKLLTQNMRPLYYSQTGKLSAGKTYIDDNKDPIKSGFTYYKPGYHIYLDKNESIEFLFNHKDCCNPRLFKVRYSQPTAVGHDNDRKTIVARRITILSEVAP